jgi:uncharacterized membrane protein
MPEPQHVAPADAGNPPSRRNLVRAILRFVLALFFVSAGLLHFLQTGLYMQIMPSSLPWPLALVYVSGACEILGGCAMIPARTRRLAGVGLIALLVAVFPANIHMLMHPEPVLGREVPNWLLWARLPLQGFLIAWVWWSTQEGQKREAGRTP